MGFISYLINAFFSTYRNERVDVKVSCKYFIFTPAQAGENSFSPLKEGVLINVSTKGYGLITYPPFEKEYIEEVKKNKYGIYIEFISPETGTQINLKGEIRWLKNVDDIHKPYTEMGIVLTEVKDDSKSKIVDSLFGESTDKIGN